MNTYQNNSYEQQIRRRIKENRWQLLHKYSGLPFRGGSVNDDYKFPEDAAEKFKLFIDTAAMYLFYDIQEEYLVGAGSEEIKYLILGEIYDLEKIIKHERLSNEEDKIKLFKAAHDYFHDAGAFGIIKRKKEPDEATLYIYVLFERDYFIKKSIPNEAFIISDSAPRNFNFIPKVYARYFLFYDYLLKQAKKLGIKVIDEKNQSVISSKKKEEGDTLVKDTDKPALQTTTNKVRKKGNKDPFVEEQKKQSFFDIWEEEHKKKYYEPLMAALCKLEIKNKIFISIKEDKLIWTDILGYGTRKYLAAFFYECEKENWLDSSKYFGSIPVIRSILQNTFNLSSTSDSFNDLKKDNLGRYDKYRKPFKEIIKEIKQSVK